MSPLHIGLDFGTSGSRGIAIEDAGRIVAESALPLPPSPRDDRGGSEQSPADWLLALKGTLSELCRQLGPEAKRTVSLAIDGTSSSLLAADTDGTPLSAALMYDDRRALAEARSLEGVAPSDSPVLSPSASLPKLLYLRNALKRDFLALHQADWLVGCLTGLFGHSDENNALKLGYDPIGRCWPEWLQRLNLPLGTLPQVHPVASPIGPITAAIARETGLPEGVQVFAGTTDSTAAAMATGISRQGQAVSVLGSTLVMKVLSPRPVFSVERGIYSHRLGDLWLVGGASNSGGAVLLKWFDRAQLERMTPLLKPEQPTGLDYYPLCRPGERFPINDPHLEPRLAPRPAEDVRFFQAMLEGMARIEAAAYRLLEQLGTPRVEEVLSIGGGAGN
ncbi:MAG: FGGY-family carbohydrate kinase, partial [Gammaproteobacteria bacterium]|nr:FGGY-family carbohydrate kinase [Gammaproteobacteria bacterium]MBU1960720.1 FGGY-family carbohydrate kinase [Gammaproteobacteria bacterium]